MLRVEGLTGNGVRGILHKGKILGFAGLLGCGRTKTMQILYGAAKKTGGRIFLHGQETEIKSAKTALWRGIGLIPEDRKKNGIFLHVSIKWNTSISCLKLLKWGFVVDTKKEGALEEKGYSKNEKFHEVLEEVRHVRPAALPGPGIHDCGTE